MSITPLEEMEQISTDTLNHIKESVDDNTTSQSYNYVDKSFSIGDTVIVVYARKLIVGKISKFKNYELRNIFIEDYNSNKIIRCTRRNIIHSGDLKSDDIKIALSQSVKPKEI